ARRTERGPSDQLRADRRRFRPAHGVGRRRRGDADGEGVPAARIPASASGPRAVARPPPVRCVGLPLHRRDAHGRRARQTPPREASAAGRVAGDGEAVRLQAARYALVERRMTFRTRLFLAALSAALIALVVAGVLFAESMRRRTDARIENTLVAEARLTAELLTRNAATTTVSELDEEADRIGALLCTRVTFIAPDSRVGGDSAETLDVIGGMENHCSQPEVVDGRQSGLGG